MKLIFIRHGQSMNNALYEKTILQKGRMEDPPLTEVGRIQAGKMAAFVAGEMNIGSGDGSFSSEIGQVTHIYCSLMVRAVQTGSYLSEKLGVPLTAYKGIHEVGGVFKIEEETGNYIGVAGNNHEYFQKEHPDLVLPEPVSPSGWWNRSFEKIEERYERAKNVLRDFIQKHHADDEVVIISHRGFYNIFMRVLLSIHEDSNTWFEINNASMTIIDIQSPESIGIIYANRHDYLPREFVTI